MKEEKKKRRKKVLSTINTLSYQMIGSFPLIICSAAAFSIFSNKIAPYTLPRDYVPFDVAAKYSAASYCSSVYSDNIDPIGHCGEFCKAALEGPTEIDTLFIEDDDKARGALSHNTELKTIFVSFKGTTEKEEMLKMVKMWTSIVDWAESPDSQFNKETGMKIHAGMKQIYKKLRLQIFEPIVKLAEKYPDYKIVFTGHSLGGALAVISAVEFYELHGYADRIFVYTFGKPRIGNQNWANYVDSMPFVDRIFRVIKPGDLITQMASKALGYVQEKQTYQLMPEGDVYKCGDDDDDDDPCDIPWWMYDLNSHSYWEPDSSNFPC